MFFMIFIGKSCLKVEHTRTSKLMYQIPMFQQFKYSSRSIVQIKNKIWFFFYSVNALYSKICTSSQYFNALIYILHLLD